MIRLLIVSLFLSVSLLAVAQTRSRIKTPNSDYDKYHDVVGKMLAKTLEVQYQGHKAAADRFIDQYTNWDENLHGVIAKSIRDQQKYRFRLFKYAALGE